MNALYPIQSPAFYNLCVRLLQEVRFPMHFFYRSKKMYGNFTHAFLLVYRQRLNVSYRRFVQIAQENNIQRMLCIKRIPHFTTLQKFMHKMDKRLLEKMVRACRKLLGLRSIEASIDGTGFSNTNPSHYYERRVDGVEPGNFTKTVFLADNGSKLILNVRTHSDHSSEINDFIPLVGELGDALSRILADKGYDSTRNREFCWDNGIDVQIPLRECPQLRNKYGHKPRYRARARKKAARLFNAEVYRRRSLIESVNSAIKRTLGGYVRARRADSQQKEVTLKAVAYNLEVIGRAIKVRLFINLG